MKVGYQQQLADLIATEQFAKRLVSHCSYPLKIYLHGELGTGKTTLVRGLLRALGYEERVKSPSFSLVETYECAGIRICHFDFYRIVDPIELEYIGIHDYFADNMLVLCEWPEKANQLLPRADMDCYLKFSGQGRVVELIANTIQGQTIIAAMKRKEHK